MTAIEQSALARIDELFAEEMRTLTTVLATGEALVYARRAASRAERAYSTSRFNIQTPALTPGYVIARELGASCLVTIKSDESEIYWEARTLEVPEGQYFIGDRMPPTPMDAAYYHNNIIGVHPDHMPRMRINGLDPDGEQPARPYELLVSRAELGSLVVAQLADIPPELRFWPFAGSD